LITLLRFPARSRSMSSPCGWGLCRETRSRTTCGVKFGWIFSVWICPPCETYLFFLSIWRFFYLEDPPMRFCFSGGCSCGALPNAPREQRPDEERVRSDTRLDLGFAAFFFTRAQQPMWPFWRQKIGSCNQKTGPVENVGLDKLEPWERASITGLQKNRGPGEQGNPKKTAKQRAGT
jgi:hypothetical protein